MQDAWKQEFVDIFAKFKEQAQNLQQRQVYCCYYDFIYYDFIYLFFPLASLGYCFKKKEEKKGRLKVFLFSSLECCFKGRSYAE